MTFTDYRLGCRMPLREWNRTQSDQGFAIPSPRRFVGPFPPRNLVQNVSGLTSEADFASQGADLYLALSKASPKPLTESRRQRIIYSSRSTVAARSNELSASPLSVK